MCDGEQLLPVLEVHVHKVLQLLLDGVHLALHVHDARGQAQLAVVRVLGLVIYVVLVSFLEDKSFLEALLNLGQLFILCSI